jgi:hypothetical protein
MRNLITAGVILLIALPACLLFGYWFVPGVHDAQGRLTNEFLFNSYLILWGFLLTTAAVGPLVAQFLQWREDRAWRQARSIARDRLADGLGTALGAYLKFLREVAADDPNGVAKFELDWAVKGLEGFFDSYEIEQTTFTAPMHGAASNIRRELQPLLKSLWTTRYLMNQRSFRIYLGAGTIRRLRALFDLEAPSPGAQLLTDVYFIAHDELYFDGRLDRSIGAGIISLHAFAPIDVDLLRGDWQRFLKECPGEANLKAPDFSFEYDADTQARLHAKYVRAHIEEELQPYIINPRVGLAVAPKQSAGG